MRGQWRRYRQWLLSVAVCVTVMLCHSSGHLAQAAVDLTQGRALYEAGRLTEAKQVLESGLQIARSQNDPLSQVLTLSNLALVDGQLGDWSAANESIDTSLSLLKSPREFDPTHFDTVLAQTLNVQGRLQFAQGQPEAAFRTWQRSEARYRQAKDNDGIVQSQLRQARALQALGFHQRAVAEILYPLYQQILDDSTPSFSKVTALNSLAEAFQVIEGGQFSRDLATAAIGVSSPTETSVAQLPTAAEIAQQSLAVAEQLDDTEAIAIARLTLGNLVLADIQSTLANPPSSPVETAALSEQVQTAQSYYQQASQSSVSPENRVRAQLNQLQLLVSVATAYASQKQIEQTQPLFEQSAQLWQSIYSHLDNPQQFPTNRTGIYARINLAQQGLALTTAQAQYQVQSQIPQTTPPPTQAALQTILEQAQTLAQSIDDRRSLTYAKGTLGTLMQAKGEINLAATYTENALQISRSINATDITYRWYEQLGKLAEAANDRSGAIAAYTGAVNTLKSLRTDLVTINPELLFSFESSIEPIHRRLIDLLLESKNPSQTELEQARDVIESLQVEELNSYLKAACLNAQVATDEISLVDNTAVLYPVILEGRLATIVSYFPGNQQSVNPQAENKQLIEKPENRKEQLEFYQADVSTADLKAISTDIEQGARISDLSVLGSSQQLYDFLFPAEFQSQLAAKQIDTLVFVLDGFMRNLSMATLFDGDRYLIEDYAIAITPGLQLLNTRPAPDQAPGALAFGLTQTVENEPFPPLPGVQLEIGAIAEEIPTQFFFDSQFTREQVETSLSQSSKPIVHLATHGKFSADIEDTFILSSDQRIYVNELSQWLRTGRDQNNPIELLVLSACETAISDSAGRAALGFAGIVVQSGAKSTIASLWQADDVATSIIMETFYRELANGNISKAKALQKAQKEFIETSPEGEYIGYWGPFVLVGNWL
ncbi:CHAT domain-containing protein [cf. Phormidesmis sp. LEGE 11477]|uniref:CHAT domain-containing protein n=1 Tax=cf. Phormidesmis sp. LEGE 11477 TaxID=1828680 RepID=UPI00187EC7B2|nr:CHAT domain-containing protein [cf. Phormidesmis sp. LEGE 11477]MBE9062398.1 CHAT domain-containing protein [cf. Phormidesmis sp. LEGE 11477]